MNSGRDATRERMDGIDGDKSEPAGDVYLRQQISAVNRTEKIFKNERPSSRPKSNSSRIVPFEPIHVCLEFIGGDEAEWDEMYPGGEWVGGEESVEFWVCLATKNRGFTRITVYSRVEVLRDCYELGNQRG